MGVYNDDKSKEAQTILTNAHWYYHKCHEMMKEVSMLITALENQPGTEKIIEVEKVKYKALMDSGMVHARLWERAGKTHGVDAAAVVRVVWRHINAGTNSMYLEGNLYLPPKAGSWFVIRHANETDGSKEEIVAAWQKEFSARGVPMYPAMG